MIEMVNEKTEKLTFLECRMMIFFCILCVPVHVCTLAEKVLYEGLGHRTEMDVNPAPIVAAV